MDSTGVVLSASIPSVLIVVADSDLARALATGLETCGLTCDVFPNLAAISSEALQDRQALLVDVALLPAKPQPYVASLRAERWPGLIVFLAEDSEPIETRVDPPENVTVLVKPFGTPQLLDVVQRLHAARH